MCCRSPGFPPPAVLRRNYCPCVDERAIPRRAWHRLTCFGQRTRTRTGLRRWFTSSGERSAIYGTVRIRVDGTATVGDLLVIEGYDAQVSIKVARGATLSIGDDV